MQVLEVLKIYNNHIVCVELACMCLSDLCGLKGNAVLIARTGGIRLVSFMHFVMLENHQDNITASDICKVAAKMQYGAT